MFEAMSRRFMDPLPSELSDVMPLCDENRLIVSRGLEILNRGEERPALPPSRCCSRERGSSRGERRRASPAARHCVTAVGFGIAPRLNAAGRITDAMEAVELLLADTPEQAQARAESLCRINVRRQEEENRIATEAYRRIDAALSVGDVLWNRQVLVLEDDGWAQGVIGIVASRITEKYGLPSIPISFEGVPDEDGQEIGKGSGRSVRGLNRWTRCRTAGICLSVSAGTSWRRTVHPAEDIPAFRERLNEYAAAHLTDDMTAQRQRRSAVSRRD